MSENTVRAEETLRDSVVTITGGTGSFGSNVAMDLLRKGVGGINICSRDEAKQDSMRRRINDPRGRHFIGLHVREHRAALGGGDKGLAAHDLLARRAPRTERRLVQVVMTAAGGFLGWYTRLRKSRGHR